MEEGTLCIIVSPDYSFSLLPLKEKFEYNYIIGPYTYKGRQFILYYNTKNGDTKNNNINYETHEVNHIANIFVSSSKDFFGRKRDIYGDVLFIPWGKIPNNEDFRVFRELTSIKFSKNN
jgi:hypothetical protein